MKLRNLIFGLFLAIGAIGFTACTGDDGSQGPKGDQGEQGDQGPPGEDASTREYSYPFLVNWGAPSGKLACDDSLLTGKAAFPGPESLTPFTMDQAALTSNLAQNVRCSQDDADTFFADFDYDADGDGDKTSQEGLLFIKTGRGSMKYDPVNSAPELSTPTRTTTTASFSGGTVVGNMVMTGSWLEPVDRRDLWRECEVGTTPSMIKGDWRAVKKETRTAERLAASNGSFMDGATSVTTLRKLCVRLDSLPGAVKCYVRTTISGATAAAPTTPLADGTMTITGERVGSTEVVGIYENEDITPTMPAPSQVGLLTPDTFGADVNFIDALADGSASADENDFQQEKLCNLFNEVKPAENLQIN